MANSLSQKCLNIIIGVQICIVVGLIHQYSKELVGNATQQFAENFRPKTSSSRPFIPALAKRKEPSNYFREPSKNSSHLNLLINTTNCQIRDFSPWDDEVKRFLQNASVSISCSKTFHTWSHVDGEDLILHEKEMSKNKLEFGKTLHCCFKIITREAKGKMRDWLVKVSNCTPIKLPKIKMPSEFIVVECYLNKTTTKNSTSSPAYRAWHSVATTINNERKSFIKKKLEFWNKHDKMERPPNILIIGQDSTSRLNFRRQAPKMLDFLNKDLKAVEMLGYNRVGENTLPNAAVFLTGYSLEDYNKLCQKQADTHDECPFIWKRFHEANYITSHIEDKPNLAIFNYGRYGFGRQQADFYIRPMMLDATKQYQTDEWKKKYGNRTGQNFASMFAAKCIGGQNNDEAILMYLESVLLFGEKNSVPMFNFYFATETTHGDLNGLKAVDGLYTALLKNMKAKGQLDNTILIVLGDHGLRFGGFKKTFIGSYEENLPNFWIYVPNGIKSRFPKWQETLKNNSRRLTTPFHLYWTLNHILDTFTTTLPPSDAVISGDKNKSTIARKYRHHFFEPLPEDSECSDVGVPETFCGCNLKEALPMNDTILKKAGDTAIGYMNKKLERSKGNCTKVELLKLIAGASVDLGRSKDAKLKFRKQITVGFITKPGNFSMEAVVDYDSKLEKMMEVSHLQRTNGIDQKHVKCINGDKQLEPICLCKKLSLV